MESISKHRLICIIALIISAVLWLTSPFIAINLLTLGDQPSALQFITDDITYIGELTESPAFWAAVFSAAGIIACFVCVIAKKGIASRAIAILAEIPMAWVMVCKLRWAEGDMEYFWDSFGFGFWGIFLLFIVVIIFSGKKEDDARLSQTKETEGNP